MQPIDDKQDTVTFRAVSKDERGMKAVEKVEVDTHNIDTLKHIEKKLIDKGLHRLERHPRDGLPIDKLPKGGRGGKYTWDGPGGMVEDELDPTPPAIDEKDPNYVDEEAEARVARGEEGDGVVVGEVEVAKAAEEGVARIDVDPKLQAA